MGGGSHPVQSLRKENLFSFFRMSWKIWILTNKFAKYVNLDLFYVLVYSGSFDMHIENKKKLFSKVCKNRTGTGPGVGAQNVTDRSVFFIIYLDFGILTFRKISNNLLRLISGQLCPERCEGHNWLKRSRHHEISKTLTPSITKFTLD